MVILALDPGRRKTGIALGNTVTGDARALETVRGGLDAQARRIGELCERWAPGLVVVGLPDRSVARKAHDHCQRLAAAVAEATGARTEFVDEAYTTREARSRGAGKAGGVDAMAAQIIAEDWLAARNRRQRD